MSDVTNESTLRSPGESQGLEDRELSTEELDKEGAEEMPDREAMSLVNANLALPINAAVAANVLSDNSNAGANAVQAPQIGQHN